MLSPATTVPAIIHTSFFIESSYNRSILQTGVFFDPLRRPWFSGFFMPPGPFGALRITGLDGCTAKPLHCPHVFFISDNQPRSFPEAGYPPDAREVG